jgi:hypothetical protein
MKSPAMLSTTESITAAFDYLAKHKINAPIGILETDEIMLMGYKSSFAARYLLAERDRLVKTLDQNYDRLLEHKKIVAEIKDEQEKLNA